MMQVLWNREEEVGRELLCCAIGDNVKLYPCVKGMVYKGSIRRAYHDIKQAYSQNSELMKYTFPLRSEPVFVLHLPFGITICIEKLMLIGGWSTY